MSRIILLLFVFFSCNVKPTPGLLGFLMTGTDSATVTTGTIVLSPISGNTNEFGVAATFTVALSANPSELVYACLKSSDTTKGGVIKETSPVFISSVPCNSSYLLFTSENGTTKQTVRIEGARGTIGEQSDTNYTIEISLQTTDSFFSSSPAAQLSVINKNIDIPGSYFIRVYINNLSGTLNLKNNSSEQLSISLSGYNNFPTALVDGSSYSVSVESQPTSQVCSVQGLPFGTLSSAHAVVTFECVVGYIYNGTLFGSSNPPTINQSYANMVSLAGSYPTVTNGFINGTSTLAQFDNPIAIATDGQNLFVADLLNNAIRKLNMGDNSVTTLGTSPSPHGVTTDGVNVYVSSFSNHIINKINISTGTVSLLSGQSGNSGNVDGATGISRLNEPTYLTTDAVNVYVTDRSNNQIRKISLATGVTSSLSFSGLTNANGITTDGTYLYVANSNNHQIIRYNLTTNVQITLAGSGVLGNADNATGTLATFNKPYGLTMDGSFLYILEGDGKKIRKMGLSSPNPVTTIAIPASNGLLDGTVGLPGTARFCNASNCDTSITTDGNFLFLSDRHNHSIRKITY
ncbi:MAG: hypothetical protein SH817_00120 [Leptospira sp.]|nr:hypothetical protein [Leptospira sp.]